MNGCCFQSSSPNSSVMWCTTASLVMSILMRYHMRLISNSLRGSAKTSFIMGMESGCPYGSTRKKLGADLCALIPAITFGMTSWEFANLVTTWKFAGYGSVALRQPFSCPSCPASSSTKMIPSFLSEFFSANSFPAFTAMIGEPSTSFPSDS